MNGIMAWGKRGFPLFTNQWSLTPLISRASHKVADDTASTEETPHRFYREYRRRRKMNGILNCGKRGLLFF